MIIEVIANIFFGLLEFIVGLLPSVNFEFPSSFIGAMSTIVSSVDYFLPINILFGFLQFSIALDMLHIVWKGLMRIKSFIPTMGA